MARPALLRDGVAAALLLLFAAVGEAGYQDAYIQTSVFHHPGYASFETSGYGRFGSGYSGVPFDFSWGDTIVQPGGPEVTSAWAGFGTLLAPNLAGFRVKDGTGLSQSGGNGFSPASVRFNTSGIYYWYPDQPGQVAIGIVWMHYILKGHVGPAPTDYVEFTADAEFNTASAGMIPLHLHYKNSQPGSTFSGVDLYVEAPFSIHTVNGNFRAEFDIVASANFTVVDPGEGSLSGVGNLGPATGSGPSPTPVPIVEQARAQNISTRQQVLSGENVLSADSSSPATNQSRWLSALSGAPAGSTASWPIQSSSCAIPRTNSSPQTIIGRSTIKPASRRKTKFERRP
ncbi:MAG: hypothetical protein M3N48_07270 [Verrucomicrobiota bacterium]|nr:hypothetical protein [Verrucomicrobiota bacterium]